MDDSTQSPADGNDHSDGQRYDLIARGAQDGIWDIDLVDGSVTVSARWLEIAGVEDPPTSFEKWLELVHPEDRILAREAALAHLSGNTDHLEVEVRIGSESGGTRWVLVRGIADGEDPPRRMAGSITDTSSAHVTEHRLRYQAFHDPLTGLPNRTFLMEELNRHQARERRNPTNGIALLFLDLVGFKTINDNYGHDVGDEILRTIGRRLQIATRPDDLPTRLGGDEFLVVMAGIESVDGALVIAERLVRMLRQPIAAGGREHRLVPSAGIVITAGANWSPDALIREADTAMYRAKRRGSDRIESHVLVDTAGDTAAPLATSLAGAAEEGRLLLHYQPIVDLASAEVLGYEALLRWRRPGRGVVPAYGNVHMAPTLDGELSRWALQHSVAEVAASPADVPMLSVNVSRIHLVDANLVDDITRLLATHDRDPSWLCLEVSARSIDGLDTSFLQPLRRLGVKLYLDDYGSGETSIRRLHDLRPDAVKIDSSITAAMLSDEREHALVRSIVAACAVHGIPLIGEGLEVPATARALLEMGCASGQGNLFAAAAPPRSAFADVAAIGPSSVSAFMLR